MRRVARRCADAASDPGPAAARGTCVSRTGCTIATQILIR